MIDVVEGRGEGGGWEKPIGETPKSPSGNERGRVYNERTLINNLR